MIDDPSEVEDIAAETKIRYDPKLTLCGAQIPVGRRDGEAFSLQKAGEAAGSHPGAFKLVQAYSILLTIIRETYLL